MNVNIKKFDVAMQIKNKGIELDVSDTSDNHLGDLVITKRKIIWCPGKTSRRKGKGLRWDKFIQIFQGL